MKDKTKKIAALAAALATVVTLSGCAAAADEEILEEEVEITEEENFPAESETPEISAPEVSPPEEEPAPVIPAKKTITYFAVQADGVNLRSGAGTSYSVAGTAEKSTLMEYDGEVDGWYRTKYRDKTVYISKKYCTLVVMDKSENEQVEAVISQGCNFLGTPYVYGAVRLHDGKGNMLKGFTKNAFDCSSLMQYMFYEGAGKLLNVTTRTQVSQGKTVSKSQLKRGDLMFFTNASRKNNTGVERIGHVAIYLGDNYILHTASDYAKIEQISATRWGYFIQAQRML
ncbi:MAG: C40 family peptidase [Clostridia bacterium]|nr:C40 family peptidase [Clostridia bacterium]